MIRGLASLALILVVAGCGASSASPAASGPAASPLPAGTYTSSAFQPPVSYTLPDGWTLASDTAGYLQLHPVETDLMGLHLFRDVVAASQDPSCPTTPEPGVGRTSSELVTWMRGLPGLSVGAPVMVTVGGLRGTAVDIAIAPGWTQSCSFANGLPTVPLLTNGADLRWVVAGSERLRLYVLDLPGGGTVIADLDAFDGDLYGPLIDAGVPIVKSLQFATG
ncbi:MAG: hypothetical protein MUQ32_10090 [Chloroflexi bacterium]|nr:hypothetical protein [Chloroflexota bacterium]